MDGIVLHGWDETNKVYVKILVDANGNLIINPVNIIDDTPVDGETGKAISSNWAYDHKEDVSAHHAKYTDSDARASINNIFDSYGRLVAPLNVNFNIVNWINQLRYRQSLASDNYCEVKSFINNPNIYYSGHFSAGGKTSMNIYRYNGTDYKILQDEDHDHTSGNGAQINHTTLSNIGTNTHAQIDSYIADSSPRVRATATGGQSVPSGTPSKVQFNNETWDVHSEYDNTTNYRFTANSDGYYKIDVSFRFATATWNIGTFIFIAIYVNGVQYSIPFWLTVVNTAYDKHMITCFEMVNLSAYDYVEIYVYQGDGVAHNLDNSALYNRLLINKLK